MSNLLQPNVNPTPELFWTGASGRQYQFYNYPIGTVFKAVPGVYIFCRALAEGRFQSIYVGETDNLWRRVTNELKIHHCWQTAIVAGVTHISAIHIPDGDAERLRIEADLRHGLNPPLNRQ